jgi:regulator of sigma D
MSNAVQAVPERRQRTYQLIAELKNERDEVWSLYCHIAGLKPFSANKSVKKKVTQFSQMLIDYISLGHFGVYERLLGGTERRSRVLDAAKQIYPELSMTTDAAVWFNDKYADEAKMKSFDELAQDLSMLGEKLAKRIDLEDHLCELMLR